MHGMINAKIIFLLSDSISFNMVNKLKIEGIKSIRELFEKLKKATNEPETVTELCERYLSDSTPTYELSINGATIDSYNFIPYLKNREIGLPIIKQLASSLTDLLHERGYRNNIITHQEHILHGSSGSGLNPNANEFPYIVGAILNKQITVEEARKARKLEEFHGGAIKRYWRIEDSMEGNSISGIMLLPLIDDFGKTLRDPVLVNRNGIVIAEELVDGAPYKR
jgi:hypothetical protein